MYNRLISFLSRSNILMEAQNGFRKKGQLRQQYTPSSKAYWKERKKEKNPAQIGIFCDLTKAYDVTDHKILLAKLNVYRVRGNAYSWFESYLAHQKQVVEINYNGSNYTNQGKHVSTLREMKHSVPQGSILGQILFLLYLNDLPINIQESKR
jgi:hypothetical protein